MSERTWVSQRARAVKVGSGRAADSEMGPVVTRDAQQRILGLIDSGEKQEHAQGRGSRAEQTAGVQTSKVLLS